ncbi:hypothetical protein SK854_08980 [Lentzea sp. BCCO 10_0061]|uniref:Uncharacterized protein n=1 Tax=Lentzea sokolovensis TaxID=3095429 RepID=A0ABU4URX8_9PSEU|nr:hypothetical protein [Lentzea sp. BCCO 10_0061]MDX8142243.1 hypothetical protein [Lentzea sp. BCCO 10_0061]
MVAATLAAIAFVAGFRNLLPYADLDHAESSIYLDLFNHKYDAPIPALRFVVTVTSLNPAERRLQATLALVPVSRDHLPRLVDSNGGSIVQESGVIKPEFADAKLIMHLRSGMSVSATTVHFPVAKVVDPLGNEDPSIVTASIPVDVDPTQFPNDVYSLILGVNAYLPSGLNAVMPQNTSDNAPVTPEATRELPVAFGIAVDHRLGRWNLYTNETVSGGIETSPYIGERSYKARIEARFARDWTYWAFIYAVSLMPAVIGLSFFVRTRRRRGVSAGDTSAAMELAAALLALIALRQVFVPTDITGLTRLDFVLGVQLLAVCWLMAVTYVSEPPASPPPARKPAVRRRRLTPRLPDGAVRRIT